MKCKRCGIVPALSGGKGWCEYCIKMFRSEWLKIKNMEYQGKINTLSKENMDTAKEQMRTHWFIMPTRWMRFKHFFGFHAWMACSYKGRGKRL